MKNKNIKNTEDLARILKSAVLTDAEKADIKSELMDRLGPETVRKNKEARLTYETNNWSIGVSAILTKLFYKPMPLVLALAVLFGGGASFAAEGSLPGELLYPVKVGVNERVGEVLAFSTEAKANFEAKLAARRAEEMAKLSEQGEVSVEVAERLKAKFEIRAERAHERLAELEAEGKFGAAIEANTRFQALLDRKAAIFTDKIGYNGGNPNIEELMKFSVGINGEKGRLISAQARAEAQLRTDVPPGFEQRAEGKLKATENKIAESIRFIESQKDNVSAEVYAEAQAKLVIAENHVVEGKAQLEAQAYAEAFISFNRAFSTAMEAKNAVMDKAERARRVGVGINAELRIGGDNDEATEGEEAEEEAEESENKEENESNSSNANANANANARGNNSNANAEVNVEVGL